MKIVVLGNEAAFKELSSYQNKIDWVWLQTADEILIMKFIQKLNRRFL